VESKSRVQIDRLNQIEGGRGGPSGVRFRQTRGKKKQPLEPRASRPHGAAPPTAAAAAAGVGKDTDAPMARLCFFSNWAEVAPGKAANRSWAVTSKGDARDRGFQSAEGWVAEGQQIQVCGQVVPHSQWIVGDSPGPQWFVRGTLNVCGPMHGSETRPLQKESLATCVGGADCGADPPPGRGARRLEGRGADPTPGEPADVHLPRHLFVPQPFPFFW